MMDAPPPLLARRLPPCRGLPLQQMTKQRAQKRGGVRYHRGHHCSCHGQQGRRYKCHGHHCLEAEVVRTLTTTAMTAINVDDAHLLVLLRQRHLGTAIIGGIRSPQVIAAASLPLGFRGVTKRGGGIRCWQRWQWEEDVDNKPSLGSATLRGW